MRNTTCSSFGPNDPCKETLYTKCVIYTGSNLPCIQSNTNDSLESVLGKIDNKLCGIILSILTLNSNSVSLSGNGTTNAKLKADVKISATSGNIISINSDGLYASNPNIISFTNDIF